MFKKIVIGLCVLGLIACSSDEEEVPYDPARDYFTFANYKQFGTRHLALDLDVDFERQQLRGHVSLFMTRLDPEAETVVLDIRDVEVLEAALIDGDGTPQELTFSIGETHPMLGQPLRIQLPGDFESEQEFELRIKYNTDPGASALQWLPPELTSGGQHPLLFSQSQSIHARSWIPLQDTPSMRVTYEATISTPEHLLALMSADNDPMASRGGEYQFSMPQPIPSYLMAIAVGNFFFAPLGDQTGLYSEPELLSASAWEFAETQQMMDQMEQVYGPYQWGRYDLLILPPSFPFGGMENPRLSFITPSVLAGDRSLTSLIAHELAHSWSGNLVTNATWRDIWLNEGMTSYLDARVMEMIYSKARADEERYLSYTDLLAQFEYVTPKMQALAPEMREADPDESQGSVHYAKGQLFLERLEELFGRETFDEFLSGYFAHFEWQSITTEQFLAYLDEQLLQVHPGIYSMEQVARWMYEPGLPDDAPIVESQSINTSTAVARAWAQGELATADIPSDGWSPNAVVNLINQLPDSVTTEQLTELDEALGLSTTSNAAISRAWFAEVAKRRFLPAYPSMEAHVNRYGRTWLISGVYRGLVENGRDGQLAQTIYEGAKASYHPLTRAAIERELAKG